ncbi:MAG: hypothetical protein CMJ39_08685 [Phycisphaerae bacterium]|nr:hypothetical protein [Phycisphaerae bacterium]
MLAIILIMMQIGLTPDQESAKAAFTRYCLDCHEAPRPKADLDLAAILNAPSEVADSTWDQISVHLRGRTMPPAKYRKRPTDTEYQAMQIWVDSQGSSQASRAVTLRRLNATEYENTIQDLLDVEFDADEFFPDDDVGYGFDTIGDVLTMSPLLTERYLDAAERIAAEAIRDPNEPEFPTRRFEGDTIFVQGAGRKLQGGVRLHSRGGAIGHADLSRPGRYRIRYSAWGQQAGPDPVRMAVRVGNKRIARHDVPEKQNAPGLREIETTLPAGELDIGVYFTNDYYRPEARNPADRDRNAVVEWIEIIGPLDAPMVGAFQEQLPSEPFETEAWLDAVLGQFLPRLWRGPVPEIERRRLMTMAREANDASASRERVLRTALTAALMSPRFLYRLECMPGEEAVPLEAHELATRLSYFLWSSTPPDWLLKMATAGDLEKEDGRRAAVERLLSDPRSKAVAENFATQWLQIRDLTDRRPDPDRYPGIDERLLSSMQQETVLYFDDLLRNNHEINDLLASNHTFIDKRLAAHYDLPVPDDDGFVKINLEERSHPGGLLYHAGVMTATSNPTRTSIVKRGKWVLEALLDQPPPPPPPGIDGLPEDGGDSTASLREQMERHRADPSCAACHIRMDALGFALEELDAVGRRRSMDQGKPVDARGELPDGRIINGPKELGAVLLEDPAVHRSLASHLLIYALGRGLTPADEASLQQLVDELAKEPTIRRLVHEIVELEIFRMRSGLSPL